MIQALRNIFGKEAVCSGRGSLNEHQANNSGQMQNKLLEAQKERLAEFYGARIAGLYRFVEWSGCQYYLSQPFQ